MLGSKIKHVPLAPPPRTGELRVMGLDLGQAQDHSCAALLCRQTSGNGFVGPLDATVRCRWLRRWPLKTEYHEVVETALDVPADHLVLDYGGVGRPVAEIVLKRAAQRGWRGKVHLVNLIASNSATRMVQEAHRLHMNVPKVDVVSSLSILLELKLLELPRSQESELFKREMADFQMRHSKRTVQFGNEPGAGKHDDVVIAVSLACWWLKRLKTLALFC